MLGDRHSPALLVFTLGARGECERRSLLPGLPAEELALRRSCLDAALEAGRESGCRLLISSPGSLTLPGDAVALSQHGESFGERLENAVAEAEALASGALLVVGSDVPGLTGRHLRAALELLEEDPERVVVGPSPDGGVYLLASRRPLGAILPTVRWCQRSTRTSLVRALVAAGLEVTFLEPLEDLDRPADLALWLARARHLTASWRILARRLRDALASLCRPLIPHRLGRPRRPPVPVPVSRGPPVHLPRRA